MTLVTLVTNPLFTDYLLSRLISASSLCLGLDFTPALYKLPRQYGIYTTKHRHRSRRICIRTASPLELSIAPRTRAQTTTRDRHSETRPTRNWTCVLQEKRKTTTNEENKPMDAADVFRQGLGTGFPRPPQQHFYQPPPPPRRKPATQRDDISETDGSLHRIAHTLTACCRCRQVSTQQFLEHPHLDPVMCCMQASFASSPSDLFACAQTFLVLTCSQQTQAD